MYNYSIMRPRNLIVFKIKILNRTSGLILKGTLKDSIPKVSLRYLEVRFNPFLFY